MKEITLTKETHFETRKFCVIGNTRNSFPEDF